MYIISIMVNIAVRKTFVIFYFLCFPIIINSQDDDYMKCYTGKIRYETNPPANYIKETFKEEKRPAYTAKSEYPLNEGCVIFFKLVHMQHSQTF